MILLINSLVHICGKLPALVIITREMFCVFIKYCESLWTDNVWERFVLSLAPWVSIGPGHMEKVCLFITTIGLFGPVMYGKSLFIHKLACVSVCIHV